MLGNTRIYSIGRTQLIKHLEQCTTFMTTFSIEDQATDCTIVRIVRSEKPVDDTIKIRCSNGCELEGSPDQKVMTQSGAYLPLSSVRTGDYLYSDEGVTQVLHYSEKHYQKPLINYELTYRSNTSNILVFSRNGSHYIVIGD